MNYPAIANMVLAGMLMASCDKKETPAPPPENKPGHTIYVSPDGSDGNPGTLNAPVKSIKTALGKVLPGDTVMARKGIYYEQFSVPASGTVDKQITLKAYPGENPVIDGSNVVVSGWQALVTFNNIRYFNLEGFDICNLTSSATNTDPEGIFIYGDSHHINIRNCNIYNIKNTTTLNNGRSAHAILVIGNGTASNSGLVITGCTVHDTQTGTSENITLAGNVEQFTISHNRICNTENIGIIVAGGDGLNPSGNVNVNYARNGVVSDNELYNVSMSNSADIWGATNYGAIAIYVCGGAGVVIERNKVYNSDRGIGLVSESNIYATRTSIVRNNFVYNCWRTGIYMGDYLNYTHGGTYDCSVVNNTLFQNNRTTGAFGEIEGEIRLTERCFNNVIRNNIVYARPVDIFIHKYTSTGSGNIIDNNLYYTTGQPQWIWNGTSDGFIKDFGAWKQASGTDVASMYGTDPLLMSITTPDLHLQANSPAKNNGFVISPDINGTLDIDGNPRISGNKISLGAQQ